MAVESMSEKYPGLPSWAGVRVPAAVKARARRGVEEALVVVPMGVFLGLVTGGEL